MADTGRPELSESARRRRYRGRGRVAQLAAGLQVSDAAADTAEQVFVQAHKADLLQGMGTERVAAASVVLGARLENQPLSGTDLAAFGSPTAAEITTTRKTLAQELELPVPPVPPATCLAALVEQLDVSPQTRRRAESLLAQGVEAGLANGRAPEGVAAGALLCAAPDAELSGGTIKDVTSVTDATIYNRRGEFRDLT